MPKLSLFKRPPAKPMTAVLIALAVVGVALGLFAPLTIDVIVKVDEAPPLPPRSNLDAPMARAYQLRQTLDAAADRFKADKTIHCCRGPDLTALVATYIPVGSSFEAAEALLRNAGLSVEGRHTDSQPHSLGFNDNVNADLPLGGGFPCGHKLAVSLTPRAPGDYSVVSKLNASIVLTCL